MIDERRQHSRVPYGAWVEIEEEDQGLRFYPSINLSVGGLLLRAPGEPPPLGQTVRMRLVVENETRVMTVKGEVVRHDRNRAFAVRFTSLEPIHLAFLTELVGELAKSRR